MAQTTCATCTHAVVDRDSWSHLACAIPLPQNLIAALRTAGAEVDDNGFVPDAPTRSDWSCALWRGEDAVLDDDGLPG